MLEDIFISEISKTKKNLLIHSIQLLSNKLWDDITIEDIEEHLCKTRGAIFHHYKTKDDLFANAFVFITYYIINILEQNERPSLKTIINCLASDFNIKDPSKGFFLLIIQAKSKNINIINQIFNYITEQNIEEEQSSIGKEFINMCSPRYNKLSKNRKI